MRKLFIAILIALSFVPAAQSQVSVNIGINVPVYPHLVRVPGYPVYYAPSAGVNYFFYDGLYWVFMDDNWYSSAWYNGPWRVVGPEFVPLYVLRVPVRYYVRPPVYFRGWSASAPPRWDQHWGPDWERRRGGWDRWDRRAAPAPAPLPSYQQQYRGDRYPGSIEQQHTIRENHYRYQPRDAVVREQLVRPQPQAQPEPRVQRVPEQRVQQEQQREQRREQRHENRREEREEERGKR